MKFVGFNSYVYSRLSTLWTAPFSFETFIQFFSYKSFEESVFFSKTNFNFLVKRVVVDKNNFGKPSFNFAKVDFFFQNFFLLDSIPKSTHKSFFKNFYHGRYLALDLIKDFKKFSEFSASSGNNSNFWWLQTNVLGRFIFPHYKKIPFVFLGKNFFHVLKPYRHVYRYNSPLIYVPNVNNYQYWVSLTKRFSADRLYSLTANLVGEYVYNDSRYSLLNSILRAFSASDMVHPFPLTFRNAYRYDIDDLASVRRAFAEGNAGDLFVSYDRKSGHRLDAYAPGLTRAASLFKVPVLFEDNPEYSMYKLVDRGLFLHLDFKNISQNMKFKSLVNSKFDIALSKSGLIRNTLWKIWRFYSDFKTSFINIVNFINNVCRILLVLPSSISQAKGSDGSLFFDYFSKFRSEVKSNKVIDFSDSVPPIFNSVKFLNETYFERYLKVILVNFAKYFQLFDSKQLQLVNLFIDEYVDSFNFFNPPDSNIFEQDSLYQTVFNTYVQESWNYRRSDYVNYFFDHFKNLDFKQIRYAFKKNSAKPEFKYDFIKYVEDMKKSEFNRKLTRKRRLRRFHNFSELDLYNVKIMHDLNEKSYGYESIVRLFHFSIKDFLISIFGNNREMLEYVDKIDPYLFFEGFDFRFIPLFNKVNHNFNMYVEIFENFELQLFSFSGSIIDLLTTGSNSSFVSFGDVMRKSRNFYDRNRIRKLNSTNSNFSFEFFIFGFRFFCSYFSFFVHIRNFSFYTTFCLVIMFYICK
jgi:hypothetical protein